MDMKEKQGVMEALKLIKALLENGIFPGAASPKLAAALNFLDNNIKVLEGELKDGQKVPESKL